MSKYERGEPIRDPLRVIEIIMNGHPLYWRHKVQNSAWLMGVQLRSIIMAARSGNLWEAVQKGEDA